MGADDLAGRGSVSAVQGMQTGQNLAVDGGYSLKYISRRRSPSAE